MATITQYFGQAQLSLAAYALDLQPGMSGSNQTTAYIDKLRVAGMSAAQATAFASTYTVVDQYTDTLSGFSATVFDKDGVKYLAIRGTDPNNSGFIMDAIADIGVFEGLNGVQQYQQLKTYYQSLLASSKISSTGLAITGHSIGGLLAQMLSVDYPTAIAQTTTFNAPGVGGIGAEILQLAGLLPGNIPLANVVNVYAQPGLSATAGLGTLLGNVQSIFIEANLDPLHNHSAATLTDSLALYNLFATLDPSLITANPADGIGKITAILKAASADPTKSLEGTLDKLRTLFEQNYVYGNAHYDAVPTMDGSSAASRDDYYTKLYALQATLKNQPFTAFTIDSLAGKNSSQLVQLAQTDPAYRYALYKLNPFAVTGASALYDAVNAQGELDLYDPATGQGQLSAQYLKDRAVFLVDDIAAANADQMENGSPWLKYGGAAQYFEDNGGFVQTRLYLGADKNVTAQPIDNLTQIKFGDWVGDTLTGGSKDDRLYGMAGNDTLTGNKGNDYLEGGLGNDTYVINAGDGYDTVLDSDGSGKMIWGGSEIKGMAGVADPSKDWMHIGEGVWYDRQSNYTYTLRAGASGGTDLVVTKDGEEGSVTVRGWQSGQLGINLSDDQTLQTLDTSEFSSHGYAIGGWPDASSQYYAAGYTVYDNSTASSWGATPTADYVAWTGLSIYSNFLNLTYDSANKRFSSVEPVVSVLGGGGDYYQSENILQVDATVDGVAVTNSNGYKMNVQDFVYAGAGSDWVQGDNGNDFIFGENGNDLLVGGSGPDYLEGGQGNDVLYGGVTTGWHLGFRDDADNYTIDDPWIWSFIGDHFQIGNFSNYKESDGAIGGSVQIGFGDQPFTWDGSTWVDYIYNRGWTNYPGGSSIAGTFQYTPPANAGTILDTGLSIFNQLGTITVSSSASSGWAFPSFTVTPILYYSSGLAENDASQDELHGGDGDDMLIAGNGGSILYGDSGNDILLGGQGDDILSGGNDNDKIFGNAGDDTLDGGAGADRLEGGIGDDTYLNVTGENTIFDDDGANTVMFASANGLGAAGLSLANFIKSDGSTGLQLNVALDSGDTLSFESAFFGTNATLQFANGDTLDLETLAAEQIFTPLNLALGDSGGKLYGGAGSDTLTGGAGNDILVGHKGWDTLSGGAGDDLYLWNLGDGFEDFIIESAGSNDVLRLGAGILPDNVSIDRWIDGDDLNLRIADQNGAPAGVVRIRNYFLAADDSSRVDRIEFADGTVWTYAGIKTKLTSAATARDDYVVGFGEADVLDGLAGNDVIEGKASDDVLRGGAGDDDLQGGLGNDTLEGGAGNDRLLGYDVLNTGEAGNDTLYGGKGNDRMFGGAGNDLYLFGRGDGNDYIGDSGGGTDVLRLGAGVLPGNVTLYRTNEMLGTGDELTLVIDGSHDQVTIADYFGTGDTGIERIEFDNGNGPVWTAADIAPLVLSGTANAMAGTSGNDTFVVDNELDTITEAASSGTDTVNASRTFVLPNNVENLTLTGTLNISGFGNSMNNILIGNSSDNILDGRDGTDTAYGGQGDDTYFNVENIVEYAGQGTDTWYSPNGGTLPDNVENLYMGKLGPNYVAYPFRTFNYGPGPQIPTSSQVFRTATGNALDNVLVSPGVGAVVTLDGREGADTMIVNPTTYNPDQVSVYVDNPGDTVIGVAYEIFSYIDYTLPEAYLDMWGHEVQNTNRLYLLGDGAITGTGNSANDYLDSTESNAANTLIGGQGDDYYRMGAGDEAVELAGEGYDTVEIVSASPVNYSMEGKNIEKVILSGPGTVTGSSSDDVMETYSGTLMGGAGNDTLTGGYEATLAGGLGDDVYYAATNYWGASTVITENPGEGYDKVIFSGGQWYDNVVPANVEAGAVTGNNSGIWGNELDNLLEGDSNNNYLSGGLGADVLIGGSGNDGFGVDNSGDQIIETADGGDWDYVDSTVSYTLPDYVERLILYGTDNLNGTGNSSNNTLAGSDGDNILSGLGGDDWLDGGLGADTLIGGAGDDTYIVDDLGDSVIETPKLATEIDSVQSSVTYTLGANLENLILTGAADLDGTGNELANVIRGNGGYNTLSGLDGNDTLYAGDGDDAHGGNGNDTLFAENTSSWTYLYGDDGNDILTGGAGSNTMMGGLGNDVIVGGAGYNYLWGDDYAGAGGDDTITGGISADYVWGGAGNDLISGNDGSDTLYGQQGDDTLYGGAGDDTLKGGAGNDTLDGGLGADTLAGGTGDDDYLIDNAGDTVTENAGEGDYDSVELYLAADYTVASGVEYVNRYGSGNWTTTGNASDNYLYGNNGKDTLIGLGGNDTLWGAGGADTLIGGTGDDTYYVDNANDAITENAGEGNDMVYVMSNVAFTLAANVENGSRMFVAGGLTGNALNNTLTGAYGNDTLDGREGADTLIGGYGNDLLDGGLGADTLVGGAGNDTYIVDDLGDTVTENAGEGADQVNASITWTLGANLENLSLTGAADLDGTGNELTNVIHGNGGYNTLSGLDGNDTIYAGDGDDAHGGNGNDTLYAENAALNWAYLYGDGGDDILTGGAGSNTIMGGLGNDVIVGGAGYNYLYGDDDAGAGGDDTITGGISADYVWGGAGNDLISGNGGSDTLYGQQGDDTLYGGAGGDTLTGGAGNDLLNGGLGADTLTGGTGNDTYILGRGYGADTVIESDSTAGNTDIAQFLAGVAADQIWFQHVGNNLEASIIGTSDKLVIKDWYTGTANHVEQFKTTDGSKTLLDSNVQNLVNAMASFAPPTAGQTTLPPDYQTSLNPVIAANWQ